MILFGIALGLIDMILLGAFFIALVVGCSLDRTRDAESVKWWVLIIAGAAAVIWHWTDFTFTGLLASISSLDFWLPALWYFGFGLLYCIPEFYMAVRRAAKSYRVSWANFVSRIESTHPMFDANGDIITRAGERGQNVYVKNTVSNGEIIQRATAEAAGYAKLAREVLEQYVRNFGLRDRIVELAVSDEAFTVIPVIDRMELSRHVGAWAVFWPFYFISLVVGDLLSEIWDRIASVLINLSGRLVRVSFTDVFKV